MKLPKLRWFSVMLLFAGAFMLLAAAPALAVGNPQAGCNQTAFENSEGNGANHNGAYDPNCDEDSPSGNGNGNGNAVGKPCAGCVGNADNKNPPGQEPDGSDGNNGYECDGNKGIGKTNPAHTRNCPGQDEENPDVNPADEQGTAVLGETLAKTGAPTPILFAMGLAFLMAGAVTRSRTAKVFEEEGSDL